MSDFLHVPSLCRGQKYISQNQNIKKVMEDYIKIEKIGEGQ